MSKTFPREIQETIRRVNPKAAFISEIELLNPTECQNCGGVGFFALFLASKGPFQTPAAPYNSNRESSHFDETAGKNGGWWVGTTYTFPCPECLDGEIPLPTKQYPTQKAMSKVLKG